MKKLVLAAIVLLIALQITACNKQIVDLTYSYEWAIIKMPDGNIVEGRVQSWKDFEGEQLQVTIDGETYLVNSVNMVLMEHKPKRGKEIN